MEPPAFVHFMFVHKVPGADEQRETRLRHIRIVHEAQMNRLEKKRWLPSMPLPSSVLESYKGDPEGNLRYLKALTRHAVCSMDDNSGDPLHLYTTAVRELIVDGVEMMRERDELRRELEELKSGRTKRGGLRLDSGGDSGAFSSSSSSQPKSADSDKSHPPEWPKGDPAPPSSSSSQSGPSPSPQSGPSSSTHFGPVASFTRSKKVMAPPPQHPLHLSTTPQVTPSFPAVKMSGATQDLGRLKMGQSPSSSRKRRAGDSSEDEASSSNKLSAPFTSSIRTRSSKKGEQSEEGERRKKK